ncbi:MAG: hypothetical protein HW419_2398 [Deltaproteobacteria bacterium]|nr:hypothetical protein [Deltaproteobacteria bacterium]
MVKIFDKAGRCGAIVSDSKKTETPKHAIRSFEETTENS